MKISDFIFDFPKYIQGKDNGFCRVRLFNSCNQTFAVLTSVNNNDGHSVTNLVEDIIEALKSNGFICDEKAVFIEHYEPTNEEPKGSFHLVQLEPKTKWRSISLDKLQEMLSLSDGGIKDFLVDSLTNDKFYRETEKLILQHNSQAFAKIHRDKHYVSRKLDIENHMKPKQALADLINQGVKEMALSKFLRSDLSFLGDMYAQLEDEYIVIPEFPLDNGFIDFVVFTGRSRMDVIFIEVKGADFYLMSNDHYSDFNHNIHKAKKQLRDRLDIAVYHDYDSFRKFCHKLRKNIEKGKEERPHLLGASGELGVDPRKDIDIRTVIIGGRTRDELKESHERHKFERETIPIELDSWDSWTRRLNRN